MITPFPFISYRGIGLHWLPLEYNISYRESFVNHKF
nr:MAG TPA: hypothetical protein [Caudoviricetes sp.]